MSDTSHITDYTLPPAGREELGVHPHVILAGRAINDSMPGYVVLMAIKGLNDVGKVIEGSKVLIMGLTYKENVPDTRESPVREIVRVAHNEFREMGLPGVGRFIRSLRTQFPIKIDGISHTFTKFHLILH